MRTIVAAAVTVVSFLACAPRAEAPSSTLERYRRAREVVERGVAAHGGHLPLRNLRTIQFRPAPAGRVLFQGDMLNADERGVPPPLQATQLAFHAWLERSGLPVERIAGVHGPVVPVETLRAHACTRSRPAFEVRFRPAFRNGLG